MITDKTALLGEKYTDSITGFSGVAVGRTEWLWGCDRIGLERAGKEGKPETEWFDEGRLELVKPRTSKPGGPRDEPARASDPTR